MNMPGRKFTAGSGYRYGFNGQEKSTEIAESLTSAEFWQYDSRIGRRWNADPVSKSWISTYACFSNNPICRIDPLGNSDTTINGKNYPDNKVLKEVVVSTKSPFSKKVMDRIKDDAKLKTMGHMYIPGELKSRIHDQIKFAKNCVAQSFGDMLLLSRYQREDITLGSRMTGLINDDDEFKIFEEEALSHLRNGDISFTSRQVVTLGGKRTNFFSFKTIAASTKELTWALRNVYITATVIHNNSTDGKFTVHYHIEDDFDLKPGEGSDIREPAYNIGAKIMGTIYHGWLDNSGPHVTVDWQRKY
jgi:RHS repeat-associated protein